MPPPRLLEQPEFGDVQGIGVEEVKAMMAAGQKVQVIDVRPRHNVSRPQDIVEGVEWRDPERAQEWMGELSKSEPAFLRALREETTKRGTVLIFDEVVTGFRMAAGGAQEYFGVTADLTCLAKAVAGGLPGAALVGRADIMDMIAFTGDAKRDRTKRVADQGTYSGTPLVAAAAVAQLEILKTGEGQRELNRKGDRLRAGP